MVAPAGMSMGMNATAAPSSNINDTSPEAAMQLIGAIFKVLGGTNGTKKAGGNLAAKYIQGNGAYTIRPLGEQVKVRDAKQGEADYWSALGYDA